MDSISTSISNPSSEHKNSGLRVPKQQLNQDDFLKLVMAKAMNQNPLKPDEGFDFITQMNQFANMEQTKALMEQFSNLIATQKEMGMATYTNYLGKNVLIHDQYGITNGSVDSVNIEDNGQVSVLVGGQMHDIRSIKQMTTASAA